MIQFLTSGDLIPRHQQVFRSNVFFSGVSIPEPDTTVQVLLPLKMQMFFNTEAKCVLCYYFPFTFAFRSPWKSASMECLRMPSRL